MISEIETTPFEGQRPGTSGLRKKTSVFAQRHYGENFIQSIFDCAGNGGGRPLVIGGDGRYLNREMIAKVLAIAAANGVARAIVGRDGLLSTPAASHLIRKNDAFGGIVLSASHNPGGPDGDFGIKFNMENGGPATEALTERIAERSAVVDRFFWEDAPQPDLDRQGSFKVGEMAVEIVDPVADYADLMEALFDFEAIRTLLASGFRIAYDGMHAVTGPYAVELLQRRLGADPALLFNTEPREDFGGGHPDPNLVHAAALAELMFSADAPDFGAASDGDGDRNLILGKGVFVNPSDSLAILAANAHLAPAGQGGIAGIARSLPTSRAADRVAQSLDIPLFETPTGWKFFGNLLDAGKVTICGEESAGTGSDHVREKDGLWAILLWLNILAVRRVSVAEIVADHWRQYGRNYYARHDYEGLEEAAAGALMASLRERLEALPGERCGDVVVAVASDFSYVDPVDGSTSASQGIVIETTEGGRIVYRLSGTGTSGATLRVYLDRYEPPDGALDMGRDAALSALAKASAEIARIEEFTGLSEPTVIT